MIGSVLSFIGTMLIGAALLGVVGRVSRWRLGREVLRVLSAVLAFAYVCWAVDAWLDGRWLRAVGDTVFIGIMLIWHRNLRAEVLIDRALARDTEARRPRGADDLL